MVPDFVEPVALIAVLIPIVAMLVTLAIVLFAINRSHKARELEHAERMLAIEKGIPIPHTPPRKSKPNYPFTWPFVFIGFGLALLLTAIFCGGDSTALAFGFISLFIGLALFASRFYGVKKKEMEAAEETAINGGEPPTG